MYFLRTIFINDAGKATFIGKVALSLIVILCVWILSRLANRMLQKLLSKKQQTMYPKKYMTITKLLGNAIQFIFYFIAAIQILDIFGVNTASLIATAGIGGIAVGFGAQSLVKDIIGGLFLVMEDQFQVGDDVIINAYEGTVEELGLRTTRLRGYNGDLQLIGNGQITSVVNRSRNNQRITITIPVSYAYELSFYEEVCNEIGEAMAKERPEEIYSPPQCIGITEFRACSMVITVWGWSKYGMQYRIEREFRERFIQKMKERKVVLGVEHEI